MDELRAHITYLEGEVARRCPTSYMSKTEKLIDITLAMLKRELDDALNGEL